MSQDFTLLVVAAAVLAVLGLHLVMARRGAVWLGAVVPCLWIAAVVVMAVQDRLDLRSSLVSVAGLVMLLWMWSGGRQARRKAEADRSPGSTRQTP
ncbi:hypothetical protein GCM10010383_78110 [Streptomyces lomondensis]|uniref:Integral membrane protein n=1 Tax=Streptomyces lomondensis TaxID=68229 RepID=A0ABQ2XVL3_9ACTN|nr:hypothetical protein GCM10010383_78110 [Streptomyces lomondensis]